MNSNLIAGICMNSSVSVVFLSMYFDTLAKTLSFMLALEHRDVMYSRNVSSLSSLIPRSPSGQLDSIWALCICIVFYNMG